MKRRRRGPDRGTPEQQLRRAVLAGGGDPRFTEYPLGLLLVRRQITDEQHNAGLHYAGLYRACIGGGLRQPVGPREMSDEADLAVQSRFTEAAGVLRDCGTAIKSLIDDLAVFESFPWWFSGAMVGAEDCRVDTRIGLQALADWKDRGKREPPERG